MKSNFETALKFTLEYEVGKDKNGNLKADGGLVEDTGGVTKWGISSKAYPTLDIQKLSLEQATDIYRHDYWLRVGGDNYEVGLGIAMFDTAVNCGVGRAKQWYKKLEGSNVKDEARAIIGLREAYYYDLKTGNPDKYGKYYKGWIARTVDLRKYIDITRMEATS